MEKIDVDILEYLGRLEKGILVLVGLLYNKKYYESTFYYTESEMVLTISEDLEELIGDIKKHPQYAHILTRILKKVVPYKQMYGTLDEVNLGKWVEGVIQLVSDFEPEEISESEIKPSSSTT